MRASKLKETEKKLETVSTEYAELIKLHQQLKSEHKALELAHRNCDSRIGSLLSQLEDVESSKKRLKDEVERLKTDLSTMTQAKADLERELGSIKEKLQESLADLEKAIAAHANCKSDAEFESLVARLRIYESREKERIERIAAAVTACKSYVPLVGIQFVEFPGDGIAVKGVPEDLPAYMSGVREGDILLDVNFTRIVEKEDFKKVMHSGVVAGDKLPMIYKREPSKKPQCVLLEVGAKNEAGDPVPWNELRENRMWADLFEPSWRESASKVDAFDNDMRN